MRPLRGPHQSIQPHSGLTTRMQREFERRTRAHRRRVEVGRARSERAKGGAPFFPSFFSFLLLRFPPAPAPRRQPARNHDPGPERRSTHSESNAMGQSKKRRCTTRGPRREACRREKEERKVARIKRRIDAKGHPDSIRRGRRLDARVALVLFLSFSLLSASSHAAAEPPIPFLSCLDSLDWSAACSGVSFG